MKLIAPVKVGVLPGDGAVDFFGPVAHRMKESLFSSKSVYKGSRVGSIVCITRTYCSDLTDVQ